MSINISIQKKDLWLLSAIMIFLVGVGYVIAYNSGASPSVMGHSAEELEGVCKSDGTGCPTGVGGGSCSFGDWVDVTAQAACSNCLGAVQGPATTDGFVMALGSGGGNFPIIGYTNRNRALIDTNPPATTTIRAYGNYPNSGNPEGITMPVKKGDYWRVRNVNNVYWIPLNCGSGGGGWVADGTAYTDLSVPSLTSPSWYDLDLSSRVGQRQTLVLLKARQNAGSRSLTAKPFADPDTYAGGGKTGANSITTDPDKYGLLIVNTDSNGHVGLRSSGETSETWDVILVGYIA